MVLFPGTYAFPGTSKNHATKQYLIGWGATLTQSLPSDRDRAAGQTANQPNATSSRRHGRWGAWLFLLLSVGLLALAAAGAVAVFEYRYVDRIYPGVQAAGIPLGGMTLSAADAAIADGLTPYPGLPVVVQHEDRRWALSPSDLGVSVDSAATAAQAYAVGRSGAAGVPQPGQEFPGFLQGQWADLVADMSSQWQALRLGWAIEPLVKINDGQVNYQLRRIAQDVDLIPQEGSLTVSGLDVIAVAGQPGRQVNTDATRSALLEAARAGQGGMVPLVVEVRQPVVSSVDKAAAAAKVLLSQPLTLVPQGIETSQRFAVDRATLRQWLEIAPVSQSDGSVDLKVQVKQDLVQAYLNQISAQTNRPVQDATLDFNPETRQLKVLTPSQAGQELDMAASIKNIETALAGDQREIALPVNVLQPKVDMNKVSEMGIVELIGEGTTNYKGSGEGRVRNIATAAGKFNNVVIPPDEEFSFNQFVGDITAANGFVDSLIIAGDRTEVGVGGGVCQVSTTAFQAAVRGGFPIVERWAHSYVVSYYGKPGLDATIYTPNVDFRLRTTRGTICW